MFPRKTPKCFFSDVPGALVKCRCSATNVLPLRRNLETAENKGGARCPCSLRTSARNKNANAMLIDHLRHLDRKGGGCGKEMIFSVAFASKIGALHNGTALSCPKILPTGRMNDVKRTQPKTVECECDVCQGRCKAIGAVSFKTSLQRARLPSCFMQSM